MQGNSNEYIKHRIEEELAFVRENWEDEIAAQYVIYVESLLEKIKKAIIDREQINRVLGDIVDSCRNAEESTDDTPKVRSIGRRI